MKKILISSAFLVVFAGYVLYRYLNNTPSVPAVSLAVTASSSAPTQSQEQYTDGTYTGTTANAFYGSLQVQVSISGGKITDVELLQYPDDAGHTIQVSNSSLPILKSEVIQTQSAQVDGVSGATQTSDAFNQSLASALAQAKA